MNCDNLHCSDMIRTKKIAIILIILLFSAAILNSQIYHIQIEGTIDLGLPPYLERIIQEAENTNAAAIVLEINTFGGRLDAATQMKDILLNSHILTIAFINKRAISAGIKDFPQIG